MPSPSVELDSFGTFGDLLKFLRRRERLTQLELSIAVGYSEAQISRLEKNQRLPDLTAIKALFVPALHLEHSPEFTTRLLSLAESARQEDAPLPGVAPYKGLLFFDEADADLFFGREALTTHLVNRVNKLASDCSRLLAIVGASGSGKSSVARAGLAVALKRAGWDTRVFTPTAQPLKMLEPSLACDPANDKPILGIVDQFEEVFTLCRDETARAEFIEKLLAAANAPNECTTVVLVLRADFYSHCAHYPPLRQAIAAQQEYIGQMTQAELRRAIEEPAKQSHWEFDPGLVDLILHDIGAGATHDQEPGALPLLSHALLATWERRRGRTFTLEGYRASGGVRGAIAETAESVFTDQFDQTQQKFARDIFVRLTELGEGTEDTRRRAALTELVPRAEQAAQLRAVLNTLADARLVSLGEDSAEVAHEALIREWSRLREWLNQNREGLRLHRRLTDAAASWDCSNRDESELYRGTRLAQALDWAQARGDELNAREREFLNTSHHAQMRAEEEREAQRERELVAAQKLAEEQTRAARRLRLRALFLSGTLVIAAILALAAGCFAQQANQNEQAAIAQSRIAENERRIAFTRELSVNAISNLESDPEKSILLALQAVAISTAGGEPVLLEAEEALHRAVDTSRVLLTMRGHTSHVRDVAFSPDGQRLASASRDGTAIIWDAMTGQQLRVLAGHTGQVHSIAYSPDSKRLATASGDKTAKVWDAMGSQELFTLTGHTDSLSDVIFSPDGTRIATASGIAGVETVDHTAKVWDAVTGKELLTLTGHAKGIVSIVYSPDGKFLATASNDNTAKIWDAATGKELLTLKGHTGNVTTVAYSPDGKRLATGNRGDNAVKIWDAMSGQALVSFNVMGTLNRVVYDSAGTRLLTSSTDGTARIWDAVNGKLLLTLAGNGGEVSYAAFSPDGARVATAGGDTTVKVWDVSTAGRGEWLNLVGRAVSVAYSADGKRIATANRDKTAQVWDAQTGKELLTLCCHADELRDIAYSPDGSRVVTNGYDQTVRVWDATTGKELLTIPTQAYRSNVGTLRIAISPDGQRIAAPGPGILFTNTGEGVLKIYDIKSGKELLTLAGHKGAVLTVAYSPDGKRIATASTDRTVKVWDAETGKELLGWVAHAGGPVHIKYSPDGKRIATAGTGEGVARVWDAATGQQLMTLAGHTGLVYNSEFSPDGIHLATTSLDGTTKVWDISSASGRVEQPLTLYVNSSVVRATYSPDGKRLVTASSDGIARVYALPLDDIVAIAKSRVTRALTDDECQKYLHVDKCSELP